MWDWFDRKYLPLINSYSTDSPILELGCGRGYMLEYLRNHNFSNLKGIDISDEQVMIAKEKGFNVEVGDALEYFTKNNNKFKIIIALDFIEHFHKSELIPLFENIFNSLDEDGLFFFHTPNGQTILAPTLIYGDLTHMTIFTPNSALQLLRNVGFKQIDFYEAGPLAKNFKGGIRMVIWKMIKTGYNIIHLAEAGSTVKILTKNFIGAAKK
jgi:2-polyprenyl-3-methyl-5-hydroxy-6-metoxy-1,4-benzoquinol methylase